MIDEKTLARPTLAHPMPTAGVGQSASLATKRRPLRKPATMVLDWLREEMSLLRRKILAA
ncbi:hypothetical protein [Mesorhizobium sp. CN2-181]|uniref:hypothetical protein n=1 Tax=Mesorhizobium yinganensis TaxID=3157707 RepID=UPI0032B7F075